MAFSNEQKIEILKGKIRTMIGRNSAFELITTLAELKTFLAGFRPENLIPTLSAEIDTEITERTDRISQNETYKVDLEALKLELDALLNPST